MGKFWGGALAGAFFTLAAAMIYIHWGPNFPTLADVREIFSWLGGIVSSFFPWAALLSLVLILPKSRTALGEVTAATANLAKEVVKAAVRGDGVKLGLLELSRQEAQSNPNHTREILAAQIDVLEDSFNRAMKIKTTEESIDEKCEIFFKEYILPLVSPELAETDDSSPRIAIHMKDPLYKNSILQITKYFPTKHFGHDDRRWRRFSTRYGIVGQAWRLQRPCYDPEVSTDAVRLVEKWGMTKEEASKAGRGKQSHLALPIPREDMDFVMFFDAQPQHIFGEGDDTRKSEIFEKLYHGLEQCGLVLALERIKKDFEHLKPILESRHGP